MTLPMAMAQRSAEQIKADDAYDIGWLPNPYGGMLYNPRTHFIDHATQSAQPFSEANRPTATAENWSTWDARNAAFEAARDAGASTASFAAPPPPPPPPPAPVAFIPAIVTPPAAAPMLNANRPDSGYFGAGRAPATFLKNGVLVDQDDAPVQLPTSNTTALAPGIDWKKYLPIAIAILVIVALAYVVTRSRSTS